MGRSRGGLTSKIYALIDANGLPILLKLTEGHAHDGRSAVDTLGGIGADQVLAARGALANIKPTPNSVYVVAFGAFLYRYRNLVDLFFSNIKQFRAIAKRYERYDAHYLALVKSPQHASGGDL